MTIVWIMSYLFTFALGIFATISFLVYDFNKREKRQKNEAKKSDERWGVPAFIDPKHDDHRPIRTDV